MKTTITINNTITKPIVIQSPSGYIYCIQEGTGDALFVEDIEDDYIDYIYYDIYETLEDYKDDNVYDGGCILLKTYYRQHTVKEIIDIVKDFEGWDKK